MKVGDSGQGSWDQYWTFSSYLAEYSFIDRGYGFPFDKNKVRTGQQGFKNNVVHLGSFLAALVLSERN